MFTKLSSSAALLLSLAIATSTAVAQTQALKLNPATGDLIWPNPSAEAAKLNEFRKDAGIAPFKAVSFDAIGGGGSVAIPAGTTLFYSQDAGPFDSGTGGNIGITLPAANSLPAGTILTISDQGFALSDNAATGQWTVVPADGDAFAGGNLAANPMFLYLSWMSLVTDGVNTWGYAGGSPETNPADGGGRHYSPAGVSITGGTIGGTTTWSGTGYLNTTGYGRFGGGANITQLIVKGNASQTLGNSLQEWRDGANTLVANVNMYGQAGFAAVSCGDSGNYLGGGYSFILRTTNSNAMQIEGGNGDYLIDKIIYKGLVAWEIEGDMPDDYETTISFQEPTGNDTNYRFAKSATITTGDVVSVITKGSTGDPTGGYEGQMCINTTDTNLKVYAGGAWRTLADW